MLQIRKSNNIATFFNMLELPSSDSSLKSFIIILRKYGLDQQHVGNKVGLYKHRSKTKVVLRDLEEQVVNLGVVKHEPQDVEEQKVNIIIAREEEEELEHQ
jgi:hypothetical protein